MIRRCFKVVILLAGSMLMFSCTSTDVVRPANKPPNIFCNGSLSTRPLVKNSTCYRASLVKSMQTILNQYGFDAGQEDGVFGGRTLAAYTAFLKSQNREADAYLTSQTIRYIKSVADDYPRLSPKTKIVNISEQRDAISPKQTRPARPANPQLQRQIAELQKLERELRNPDGSYKKEDVRSREEIAADNTAKSIAKDMSRLVLGEPVRLTQTNRPFLAGLSHIVMTECAIPDSIHERGKLTSFVGSVGANAVLGIDLSITDPLQAFNSIVEENSTIKAGEVAGSRLGCGDSAKTVVDGVLRSLSD